MEIESLKDFELHHESINNMKQEELKLQIKTLKELEDENNNMKLALEELKEEISSNRFQHG